MVGAAEEREEREEREAQEEVRSSEDSDAEEPDDENSDAEEPDDEEPDDGELAKTKRRRRDNRAHFGNNPRFYLLHYMQLKGGFTMVDGDADEWPANFKRSEAAVARFKGRYVVVPKRNTKAGRASLRARFCPDLRAIGFVAPGDEASPSRFYFSRPKVDADGTPRPLDLFTLQERAAVPSAKRKSGFLEGLAQKRQAASAALAAPAAAAPAAPAAAEA